MSNQITILGGVLESSLVGGNSSNSTYYAIQTPLIDATNATLALSTPGTATWLTAGPDSTWNFKAIDLNTGNSSHFANFRINGATVNVGFDDLNQYGLMLSRGSNALSSLLVESGTLTATRIGIGRQQNNFQNAGTGSVEWSGGTIGNLAGGRDLLINSYDITDNYGLQINLTNAGDKTLSVESGRIAHVGPNANNLSAPGVIAGTNTSGAYLTGTEGRLVIAGGGTVRLYQSNSYSGQVKIDNGTLTLVGGSETFDGVSGTYSASIAPSALEIATNGTLDLQNGTGLGGSGTVTFTGGLLRFSSNSVADLSGRIANSTGAIRIDTGDNTVTFASALASNNTGGLTKTGSGTLTLGGANTYGGASTVEAGKLVVNGSISSATTVQSGATLGGSGTIASATIQTGGTIAPGNSPGTLTLTNGLTWQGGGNYNWQIFNANTNGTAGATNTWDLIAVTGGTWDIAGLSSTNKFNINLWSLSGLPDTTGTPLNFDPSGNYSWKIVDSVGITGSFNTNFFNINTGAVNGTGGFVGATGLFSLEVNSNDLF
ncbi:MAG: beta strand repeat-containing protein, partial [Ilumatobacteraceae bacterium]